MKSGLSLASEKGHTDLALFFVTVELDMNLLNTAREKQRPKI
jgi:hypothetical protein